MNDVIGFGDAERRILVDIVRTQRAMSNDLDSMRDDLDMLIRMAMRIEHEIDWLREDVRSLWLRQADLRRRVEALEDRK